MIRLLAISGSLRSASTNMLLLRALGKNAPEGVEISLCGLIGALPIFNPDDQDERTPSVVEAFARQVGEADGLIFSCPEYAHGIPGGLKNALDWLVSRDEIPHKPAILVRASVRNDISHLALQEVLRTMSVALMDGPELTIPLLGKLPEQIDLLLADGAGAMSECLARFAAFVRSRKDQA